MVFLRDRGSILRSIKINTPNEKTDIDFQGWGSGNDGVYIYTIRDHKNIIYNYNSTHLHKSKIFNIIQLKCPQSFEAYMDFITPTPIMYLPMVII